MRHSSPAPAAALALIAALLLFGRAAVQAEPPPGKAQVFLLVGQSNMQGKGSLEHLAKLAEEQPEKYGRYRQDGKWAERDDVWIFHGSLWEREKDRSGRLTVGYTYPAGRVGPELALGHVLGDAIDAPVILVKACWGGQSLAVDFRPRSAGQWERELTFDDRTHWKPGTVGWAYRQIFNELHFAVSDIGKTFPELKDREYELAGLFWFQGWNDLINAERRAEYEENMVHFIRDIRKDLDAPNLPIVIGVAGHNGEAANDGPQQQIRKAQTAAAEREEFQGNVIAVPTAPYWDPSVKYDGGYHYHGSARFYCDAGEAFGEAMVKLLENAVTNDK